MKKNRGWHKLNWNILHTLYNGIIGKSLIFISLSTPVAFVVRNFEVYPLSFVISLIGALVILIGYVICLINTPELIKKFPNSNDYGDYLIKISDHVTLSLEFSYLESIKDEIPNAYEEISLSKYEFQSLENCKILGNQSKIIRVLAIVKFSHLKKTKKKTRLLLCFLLFVGSSLIFFPTTYNIYTILEAATRV